MTGERVCELAGCGKALNPGQKRFCGKPHAGLAKQRGYWAECAKKDCHVQVWLNPSAEKHGSLHYCSVSCRAAGKKVAQVESECPICGDPVLRPRHIANRLLRRKARPCCSGSCLAVYAVLCKEFKRFGPERIRQAFSRKVSDWLDDNLVDSRVAEGAYGFARHLADHAVSMVTLPMDIKEDKVRVAVRD